MKLFLKLSFNCDGPSPLDVVKSMEELGFTPVLGDYDFVMHFEAPEEFGEIVTKLHESLKGTMVLYSLSTKND